jgi:hypothetical protein
VKAVREVPAGEEVLVVYRKPMKGYDDLRGKIMVKAKAANVGPQRIRFLTWGFHTATNDFANVRNVIVVGLLQYSMATNEAYWRAAGKVPVTVEVSEAQIHELRLGEAAHHLFQAVGRGAVRRCVGNDVPEGCRLWCIFSSAGRMGVPRELLGRVFPGAQVEPWEPFGVQLRSARSQSENRVRFYEELKRRLGDRGEVSFERRNLTGFSPAMALRFLTVDETIARKLEADGITLEAHELPERRRGGKVIRYTLRRANPLQSSVEKNRPLRDVEVGRGAA